MTSPCDGVPECGTLNETCDFSGLSAYDFRGKRHPVYYTRRFCCAQTEGNSSAPADCATEHGLTKKAEKIKCKEKKRPEMRSCKEVVNEHWGSACCDENQRLLQASEVKIVRRVPGDVISK